MPERFLVFIPAYNCEKQVPRVLNQLLDCQVAAMVTECIVVNNRSTEGPPAGPGPPAAQRPELWPGRQP